MNKVFVFGVVIFFSLYSYEIKGQTTITQQPAIIKPGDRIRLTIAETPSLVGKYERFMWDSVAIRLGRNHNFITMTVPMNKVISIEVPKKYRFTPFKKILLGTLIGASAGVLFGLVVPESPTLDNGGFYFWTRGGTMMLWGTIGAGGGLIGGVGVVVANSQQWTPATISGEHFDDRTYLPGISIALRTRFGN